MKEMTEGDLPGFEAVGRITRAVTYSALMSEVDLNLRELYAFTTLTQALTTLPKLPAPADLIDAYAATPGLSQGFFSVKQYRQTFESLAAKGLVKLTESKHQGDRFVEMPEREGSLMAELTADGIELMHTMASNLKKSLSLLDSDDVRKSLNDYV